MTTRHAFRRFIRSSTVAMVALLALTGCDHQEVVAPQETVSEQHAHAGPATISNANVVEVIARHDGPDYVFDLSDEVIPSGWTTFELDNHSSATHFVYVAQVHDDAIKGAEEDGEELLDYWYKHVTRPFQFFMDGMIPGKDPDLQDLPTPFKYADTFLPPWLSESPPWGGPGLTQGHLTSRTTMYMEPGFYVVECYVKDADGDFHSYRGMLTLLEVKDEPSGANEPRATLDVRLSEGEIQADDEVRPGLHTVAVHFDEQAEYSHLLGHDVHLIRLDGWTVQETAEWINWMMPEGLVSADGARGPRTFVGGTQTMTAGSRAYFTVRLEPGEYAWIAEVPADVGMWKTFTVPHGRTTGGR